MADAVGRVYRSAMPVLADSAAPYNDETPDDVDEGAVVTGEEEEAGIS